MNFFSEYQAALRRCSGQDYCPDPCICCKDDENHRFIINCSNLELKEIPSKLPIVENATLLFEHNNLQSLDGFTKIKGFDQLKELYCRYNSIKKIENLPKNIQLLDIRNNSLRTLNNSLREFLTQKSNMSSLTIFISGNNWICHCKEILFFRFTKNLAENIKDLCKTECHDSRLFVSLEEKDLCPEKIPRYVIYFTSFIMLSCLLSFLQCFWKSIAMWLYEKRLFLKLTTRLEKGIETKYDCFLAYCHKDSHFVREYVERLEHGHNRLRLCFYERDWLAGEPIPDCICHSVENSKCIVILMTKNFLKSAWGRLEFRLALHATSKDQYKRLIIIIYPGVENFDQLDGELQSYLKINTYLMRNDANFWNKLIYALPHKMVDECEEMEMINIET
ncbi:protein toll [Drosophila willistoni]|nr:protein toll [Drosophila willistoni]